MTDLGIRFKTLDCKEHGAIYIFNYNQITKFSKHPLVRECRNLILHQDTKERWYLISKSFQRFYNFGEHPQETKILVDAMLENDLTVTAYEKLDGSLMVLSYHPLLKEWRVYTRGAFADQPFERNDSSEKNSFSDVFLKCLHATHADIFRKLNQNYSYIFELCSPGSHITNYDKQFIGLLTITDRANESELASHIVEKIAKQLDFVRPHSFKVTSMDQLQQKLKTMPPDFERYVMVVEKNGIPQVRVKFTQDSYKALHHMFFDGDVHNPHNYIPILLAGEMEEVLTLAYAKRYEEFLREKQAQVDQVFVKLKHIYDKHKIASSLKAFATLIKNESHPLAHLLFKVFRGIITLEDCLQPWKVSKAKIVKNTHIDKVEKAIFWLQKQKA